MRHCSPLASCVAVSALRSVQPYRGRVLGDHLASSQGWRSQLAISAVLAMRGVVVAAFAAAAAAAAAATPSGGATLPAGRGASDLEVRTPTACRAPLDQKCPGVLEHCGRNPGCGAVVACLTEHDVASMAEARHCFPPDVDGDIMTLGECLADLLPQRQPPTCRGRAGNAVDWAFVYKLPAGLFYAYRDSRGDVVTDPSAQPAAPNASAGTLGGSFAHLYAGKGDDRLAYVVYNDQPPDGAQVLGPPAPEGDNGAHSKGVLVTDGEVGFWLVHSTPKLPDVRLAQYAYTGSPKFGQTYLCLSLSAQGVEQAATQMSTAHAIVYGMQMPSSLATVVPALAALARGYRGLANFSHAAIKTRGVGGMNGPALAATSYVKSPLYVENVYEDEVMPSLATTHNVQAMVWETWRRNPSILDSFCPPEHKMPSINAINMEFPCKHNASRQQLIQSAIDRVHGTVAPTGRTLPGRLGSSVTESVPPVNDDPGPGSHCSYHYTSDHAKWGVSIMAAEAHAGGARSMGSTQAGANIDAVAGGTNPNVVCVGGINRMSSQQKRGGGTVCFVHDQLHAYLRSVIATTQDCDVLPPGIPLKILGAENSLLVGATVVDQPPPHVRGDKAHKSGDLAYGDSYQPYHFVFFSQFSMFAWENCTSVRYLRPNRSAFDYHCAQSLLHYAQSQQGVTAFFDTPLVPALREDLPSWFLQTLSTAGHTSTVAATLINEHVSHVLSYFVTACEGGTIMFDHFNPIPFGAAVVVSDLLDASGAPRNAGAGPQDSAWATAFGPSFDGSVALLKVAFVAARNAVVSTQAHAAQQPSLLYADTGITAATGEQDGMTGVGTKAAATLKLLQAAKAQGAPIDGVLFKLRCAGTGSAEQSSDECTLPALSTAIEAFGAAGFQVWISLHTAPATAAAVAVAASAHRQLQFRQDDLAAGADLRSQALADIYHAVGAACAGDRSHYCKAIHFEGFTDAFCGGAANAGGCMLDGHYGAKAAYTSLQASLK